MRDIYNYLSCNPKRTKDFEIIQKMLELKLMKVLHPSATRWLSLESVVNRPLGRFKELQVFFTFQSNVDKNQTAQRILCHLNDPMTRTLLCFLCYVLPLINRINRLFQSEFPNMYNEVKSLHLVLLSNVCDESFIENLSQTRQCYCWLRHIEKLGSKITLHCVETETQPHPCPCEGLWRNRDVRSDRSGIIETKINWNEETKWGL